MPQPQSKAPDFIPESSTSDFIPEDGGQQQAAQPEPTFMQKMASGAKDLGKGVLEGVGSDAYNLGELAGKTPLIGKYLAPSDEARQHLHDLITPANTMQSVGRGAEQVGEFLVPGLGEEAATEKAATLIPRMAPEILKPAARVAYNAATSGAVNKMQGGSFGTGAAGGAAGSAIGQGMKALAPAMAESSIGVRKLDRAYGRNVGKAVLDETKGFSPSEVSKSAQGRLDQLNPQLESTVAQSPRMASLQPARQTVGNAINTATNRNAAKEVGQLTPLDEFLNRRFDTGATIPQNVNGPEMLNLRRGFGSEFVHNWNPETMPGVTGTARQAYHSMSDALHAAVPESTEIDRRISNLIPVAKRAESTSLNAPVGQRVAHRMTAHTGALASGLLGADEGYRHGGVAGAIGGGLTGLVLPEAIASPTGQMFMARGLNSGLSSGIPKLLTGGALQLDRPGDKKKDRSSDSNQ